MTECSNEVLSANMHDMHTPLVLRDYRYCLGTAHSSKTKFPFAPCVLAAWPPGGVPVGSCHFSLHASHCSRSTLHAVP